MKWAAQINEGLANLFSAKLRSLLALLGILVGTASVVAMVLGGELATSETLKQFKSLGTDLLAVSISDSESKEASDALHSELSLQDANAIPSADKNILAVAPYTQIYGPVQFEGHELGGTVLGVTEEFGRMVHVELQQGRFISDLDGYAFYCVVGSSIYDEIKSYTQQNPIGQQLQIGKNIFTIVGVAKPWPENSFVYANVDYSILVPIQTSTLLSKYANINNLLMRLSPTADADVTKANAEKYLHEKAANKNLFFRSAKELIAKMSKQSEILTVFLALIGGVSLLVGGIGVMNIMLVSVVERRREIGVRLAVGATRKDIRSLFLVEAVILALIGGILGVLIGISIAYVIALFWHWEFTLFLIPPVIGFSVSAATGVFFGFYPAHKAASLDPIDALRTE